MTSSNIWLPNPSQLLTVFGISVLNFSRSYRLLVAACFSYNWYFSPWMLLGECAFVTQWQAADWFSFSCLNMLLCSHCFSGEPPPPRPEHPCLCSSFLSDPSLLLWWFFLHHYVWAINVSCWGLLVYCWTYFTCFTVFFFLLNLEHFHHYFSVFHTLFSLGISSTCISDHLNFLVIRQCFDNFFFKKSFLSLKFNFKQFLLLFKMSWTHWFFFSCCCSVIEPRVYSDRQVFYHWDKSPT